MDRKHNHKHTDIGKVPEGWEVVGFEECILHRKVPKVGKVKKEDYKAVGKYPIIDQSQRFIAGYTDDDPLVYRGNLPIIVFGDHTRVFKLIDFPFVCGADGTKVLVPDTKKFDPRYLFYSLLNTPIQSRGYNRHYRLLRTKKISRPPLHEQQKISSILSTVDEAIQNTSTVIEKTTMLKRGLMQRLLTRGIGHTRFKETELGKMPIEWNVATLGELVIAHKAGIYKKRKFYGAGYNVVGVVDLYYHDVIDGQTFRLVKLTPEEYEEYSLREGDLIYGESSLVFEGIGKTLVVTSKGEGTSFAWHTRRLRVDKAKVIPLFLHYALNADHIRKSIMRRATRTAITGITVDEFFKTRVPLPSKTEQMEIAEIISSIDRKISNEEKYKTKLGKLRNGLMQVLLTGKVRVKVD